MTTDQRRASDLLGRVEYGRPPIVEALCQFNFASPIAWSPITPGMFYERIRAEYSNEPEVQQQLQANVQFLNDAAGQAQMTMGQGEQRVIYKDGSKSRLIVLSPSTISANSLPPYEGWPALSERFERALLKTKEILGDPQIGTVTVRYINRIFVPDGTVNQVGEFFRIPFRVPGEGDSTSSSLFQRVESVLADGITQGISTFATVDLNENESGGQAFLLDLEFRRVLSEPVDFGDAMSIAGDLKVAENAEFEACITKEARGLFR